MINRQINLQPIQPLDPPISPNPRQNPLLPNRTNQQINNQQLILLLHNHLLQHKLIIFHNGIDV